MGNLDIEKREAERSKLRLEKDKHVLRKTLDKVSHRSYSHLLSLNIDRLRSNVNVESRKTSFARGIEQKSIDNSVASKKKIGHFNVNWRIYKLPWMIPNNITLSGKEQNHPWIFLLDDRVFQVDRFQYTHSTWNRGRNWTYSYVSDCCWTCFGRTWKSTPSSRQRSRRTSEWSRRKATETSFTLTLSIDHHAERTTSPGNA